MVISSAFQEKMAARYSILTVMVAVLQSFERKHVRQLEGLGCIDWLAKLGPLQSQVFI